MEPVFSLPLASLTERLSPGFTPEAESGRIPSPAEAEHPGNQTVRLGLSPPRTGPAGSPSPPAQHPGQGASPRHCRGRPAGLQAGARCPRGTTQQVTVTGRSERLAAAPTAPLASHPRADGQVDRRTDRQTEGWTQGPKGSALVPRAARPLGAPEVGPGLSPAPSRLLLMQGAPGSDLRPPSRPQASQVTDRLPWMLALVPETFAFPPGALAASGG